MILLINVFILGSRITMRLLLSVLLFAGLCLSKPAVVGWTKLQSPIQNLSNYQESGLKHLWDMFVKEFSHIPTMQSFQNFASNVARMWEHLKQPSSFIMGINKFSAMSVSEYNKYLGYRYNTSKMSGIIPRHSYRKLARYAPLPESVDWRWKGRVTKVKDQGQCGSCWAFSAIGAIEGQYQRAENKLVSFSEQQLIDCSFNFGNMGCNGGLMDYAFTYVKEAGGVEREEDYPYVSGVTHEANEACAFQSSKAVAKVTGLIDIASGSEEVLMEALAFNGPISVAINAAPTSFMMYHEGK
ncbi:unnamed protein product [Mesocestoides corti]|uniref:Peptidase C1A papain C-terminal domain-containing protein n=1 Tax=Mesocestoides corti TaxID=53468 RepID=A0A0R3U207_MESCO|nr:unnamed protein product [Mesocestoides corti]